MVYGIFITLSGVIPFISVKILNKRPLKKAPDVYVYLKHTYVYSTTLLHPPGGYVSGYVRSSVCLLVCAHDNTNSKNQIFLKDFMWVGPD